LSTKKLVITALFIALSFIGAHLKIFGSIAFDSLPGFLAALMLGPVYGAAIGFLGHMFTALTSGFPLSLPLHIVIAVSMAVTMYGFGFTFRLLQKKLDRGVNLAITGCVGIILNGPVSLAMSMGTLAVMAGTEAAWGLIGMLPMLVLGAAANVVICLFIYAPLEDAWKKLSK